MSAPYLGDYAEDATLDFCWGSNDAGGASVTRATDGDVRVYKANGTSEVTTPTGITDTEDFDTLTGVHHCRIDTSANAFYATGNDYIVVLAGATIDGQTVNVPLAHFSIENRFDEVTLADAAHGGSNAVLTLNRLVISADDANGAVDIDNQAGPAVRIDAINGAGMYVGGSTYGADFYGPDADVRLGYSGQIKNLSGDNAVQVGAAAALTAYDPPTKAEMDTAIDGLGTGARTVTVTVTDGSDPVEGAKVRLTNGVESYVGTTDAAGQIASFNVNDKSWTVAIAKDGYTYGGTTLVVDGDKTPTYAMTAVAITPADPGQVTGYLYCYSESGDAETGVRIQWRITAVAEASGVAYDSAVKSANSDATGLVELPGLFQGATYDMRRGTSGSWTSVLIPTDAASPYELPSVIGTP